MSRAPGLLPPYLAALRLVTKPNEDTVIVITAATWWLQAHCQQRIRQSPEGELA
jgi:hypothetical protein